MQKLELAIGPGCRLLAWRHCVIDDQWARWFSSALSTCNLLLKHGYHKRSIVHSNFLQTCLSFLSSPSTSNGIIESVHLRSASGGLLRRVAGRTTKVPTVDQTCQQRTKKEDQYHERGVAYPAGGIPYCQRENGGKEDSRIEEQQPLKAGETPVAGAVDPDLKTIVMAISVDWSVDEMVGAVEVRRAQKLLQYSVGTGLTQRNVDSFRPFEEGHKRYDDCNKKGTEGCVHEDHHDAVEHEADRDSNGKPWVTKEAEGQYELCQDSGRSHKLGERHWGKREASAA